jgi:hypothetical protein
MPPRSLMQLLCYRQVTCVLHRMLLRFPFPCACSTQRNPYSLPVFSTQSGLENPVLEHRRAGGSDGILALVPFETFKSRKVAR